MITFNMETDTQVNMNMVVEDSNVKMESETGVSGSNDYDALKNKPTINGVEVAGKKLFTDYGLEELSEKETSDLFNSIFYGGTK